MQPVGPYRFTEVLGMCQVGKAWAAVDGQDRLVTVAVLEGAAATDQPGGMPSPTPPTPWRWPAAGSATSTPTSPPPSPGWRTPPRRGWEPSGCSGPSVWTSTRCLPRVPAPPESPATPRSRYRDTAASLPGLRSGIRPPHPVSPAPQQPVSGVPQSTSGPPPAPWALHSGPHRAARRRARAPADDEPRHPPSHDGRPAIHHVRSVPPPRSDDQAVGAADAAYGPLGQGCRARAGAGGGAAAWDLGDHSYEPPIRTLRRPVPPPRDPHRRCRRAAVEAVGAGLSVQPRGAALAVAAPALVFVEPVFTGYVRDARKPMRLVRATPVSFTPSVQCLPGHPGRPRPHQRSRARQARRGAAR